MSTNMCQTIDMEDLHHQLHIAAQVGTTKQTVANTLSNFNTRGYCYRTSSPGRPTQGSDRNNRYILRTIFQHSFDSCNQILGRFEGISRYHLRKVKRCVAIRKPSLTLRHIERRYQWAKDNQGQKKTQSAPKDAGSSGKCMPLPERVNFKEPRGL
ncbi:hypothetical protein IE53DRAFT_370940 [Violaceomyces palustris]|uniref:Uncharacterized protein n=1 Tax=Violaceomyces palustris TaxID=1673888 RepID=A0ACD0NQF1_9BASI|nr:hypothetical protein IE53DRAFT_370940 [Violaceomyces palustris]